MIFSIYSNIVFLFRETISPDSPPLGAYQPHPTGMRERGVVVVWALLTPRLEGYHLEMSRENPEDSVDPL